MTTHERLEQWLKMPGHREAIIERRNIEGYGQMVPGFRVTLIDITRRGRKKSDAWSRCGEDTALDTALTMALDRAKARRTRTNRRRR